MRCVSMQIAFYNVYIITNRAARMTMIPNDKNNNDDDDNNNDNEEKTKLNDTKQLLPNTFNTRKLEVK